MSALVNTPDNLLEYLSAAVAGSLVSQIADAESNDALRRLFDDEDAIRHYANVLAKQGIDPELTAKQILDSLELLYKANHKLVEQGLTNLLWDTLGDPESGKPPEIYHRAAHYVMSAFIAMLHPDFPRFEP